MKRPFDRFLPNALLPATAALVLNVALMTRQLIAKGPFSSFDVAWGKVIDGFATWGLPMCLAVVTAVTLGVLIVTRIAKPPLWIWGVSHVLFYGVGLLILARLIQTPVDPSMLASIFGLSVGFGLTHATLSIAGNAVLARR
jgi:hypothetical protein